MYINVYKSIKVRNEIVLLYARRLYDAITVMATLATRSTALSSLYFTVDIYPLSPLRPPKETTP